MGAPEVPFPPQCPSPPPLAQPCLSFPTPYPPPKVYLLLYSLAALRFCCCKRAFSSCGGWGLLFLALGGLLIAVTALVAEHGLESAGSGAVAHGLSCSSARGSFLDQGWNSRPLHWRGYSQPLDH